MAKKKLTPKEKKNRESQIDILSGCVEVDVHAICMRCNKESIGGMYDEYSLAEEMHDQGWVFKYNILYCPNCVKKYLKGQ